jgi:dipeptidyl aminopeptidase/acylaminoacyl peptidase
MKLNFFFLLCALPLSFFRVSAQSQPLTPELLWKLGRVGLECVSPDGRYAVYGVQRYDVAANKGTRALYSLELASGKIRALTPEDKSASDAAFHPDGKRVGFLMDGRLCEVSREGSPIRQVSDLEMNGFHYAPKGDYVLFTQDVKLDKTPAEIYPDLSQTSARLIDGLFYRHWKSWHDYRYSQVFYVPYTEAGLGATPINIINAPYDCPLRPMGGMEQVCWSPDGRFIVYACRKQAGTAEAQSTNSDIYVYELASGRTLNFSEDLPGYDLDPFFSPDGRYLCWTSMARPGFEADRTRLMMVDTRTQIRTELTEGWDYECNHPRWAADGQSLFFLSAKDFTYQLFQINLKDRAIRQITEGVHDYAAFRVAGNYLVAQRGSMSDPAEIYQVDPVGGAARRMTFVTAELWDTVSKGKVERRTVRTADGRDLNVWVVLPPGFDPAVQYPALLYCQGGPQSALSQFFSYRWNLQLMASKGYVVIAPCRRGMPGSGQAWCDAISGDWGGGAMQDLLDATDALAKEPWVDARRMGAIGASFGGYSVYWLAGKHNKRFKAFISHCGLFNLESFYGTTEEVWFPQYDFEGAYWQSPLPEAYRDFSPHRFVQNWDTPILVMHNELDFRVPISEGMQAFQAAQLRGIPSRFVYFPDEGHWMSKPQNSMVWQREFFSWLDRYLK